jgi:hypothetical protein
MCLFTEMLWVGRFQQHPTDAGGEQQPAAKEALRSRMTVQPSQ